MKQAVLMSFFVFALVACGGEKVGLEGTQVGGPCSSAGDCDSGSACETSGDFPGGMCTVACTSDGDCPENTRCISHKSGICQLPCSSADDCRDGYKCVEESLQEGGGAAKVCSKE